MTTNFQYLNGLHRPFNNFLKGVVWVCWYLSCENVALLSVDEKRKGFFLFVMNMLKKNLGRIRTDNSIYVVSPDKIESTLNWLSSTDKRKISSIISQILINRDVDDLGKDIYSCYKATSYFITLANKLGFTKEQLWLTDIGNQISTCSHRVFELNMKEKDILFTQIVAYDRDVFLPLMIACSKSQDYIKEIHIKYLEEIEHVNYFKYIKKSQSSNYDQVRIEWLNRLSILSESNFVITRHYSQLLEKLPEADYYLKYKQEVSEYVTAFLKNKKYKEHWLMAFEKAYNQAIDNGLHDAEYVNLYYLKEQLGLSFNKFNNLLQTFTLDSKDKRILQFNDIVMSIDGRKRFIINGKPVLKIRIVNYGN